MEKNGAPSLDAGESHEVKTEMKVLSKDRVVFVNNLPISVSEEEIDKIYSRCGQLDSIQLFNLWPDLHPGPITNKQLRERRMNKSLRNKNSFPHGESPHHRPRTIKKLLDYYHVIGRRSRTWCIIFKCKRSRLSLPDTNQNGTPSTANTDPNEQHDSRGCDK
jgi:RNA recognition motif-containing protein